MLILIAESKTMAKPTPSVAPDGCRLRTPIFDAQASRTMDHILQMSATEIAATVKISTAMAASLRDMARDFPLKDTSISAIDAFTGVVFKALEAGSLTADSRCRLNQRVRIISSLYGWLRPDDGIKPYRLDYKTPLAPGFEPLATFWRHDVTDALLADIAASGSSVILDLLPADAARCIDWKRLPAGVTRLKADFMTLLPGGATRTPASSRLKTLRGLLLRQLLVDDITSRSAMNHIATADFAASPDDCTPSSLAIYDLS